MVGREPWWVERTALNCFRIRRDELPGYSLLYGGRVRRIEARLPRSIPSFPLVDAFGPVAGTPPNGMYAVVEETGQQCESLPRLSGWAVRAGRSHLKGAKGTVDGSGLLLLCELEFR